MTRHYAPHIERFVKSKAKTMQFNFVDKEEARNCLRNVLDYIERHDLPISAWRVYTTVYLEKI